ncbi:MAG: MoaD/ThiS family protein [Planctomycetales bacterium]|nr:MoaD/ThiS family protein [Planctomycetales bacterium]
MLIKVQYTTQLKAAIGVAEESFDIAIGGTVADILQAVADKHGDAFRQFAVDSHGALLPSILLCVDDEQVSDGDGRTLAEGSVVTLLSAISGG